MSHWAVLFLTITFSSGFLVEEKHGEQAGVLSNHYITMAEFIEFKKQQRHKFETSLTLLSLQLSNKLSLLQHNDSVNSTSQLQSGITWEQKYLELEENYTKLQFSFDDLQRKYSSLESELISLKNKITEQSGIFIHLEEIKNISILQKFHELQGQIRAIGAKTFILDSNEQARNRDIHALYNKTTETEKSVNDIKTKTNQQLQELEHKQSILTANFSNIPKLMQKLDLIEYKNNATATSLTSQMQDYEMVQNFTRDLLLQRVSEANDKVGLTACVSVDGVKYHGTVIKFDQIRSHVGVLNLSAIRASGQFTCEKSGLYHVSVVINTPTTDARFSVYVNGNSIATLAISNDNHVDSGTSVVAVELQVGDNVWAQADTDIHVYFHWSCMTVVKL